VLKKKYRLTSSKDFKSIYKDGIKARGDYGMLIFFSSSDPDAPPKFGFVVGKKIGNAVDRHKHVRRLREVAREVIKEREDMIRGLKFSYISFKYSEDFGKLKKEFNSQIDYAVKRSRANK
jgi:ribonuclease P protein component